MQTIAERITEAIERSGLSYRELEEMSGVPKSAIHRYATGDTDKCPLNRLEAIAKACGVTPGYLMGWEEDPLQGVKNAIRLEKKRIPVLGAIACGIPITAEQRNEMDIETDIQCDYALRCVGDSMEPLLRNGDLVLVRKQERAESGEIAVVMIEDEATLKRVHHIAGGILLTAENASAYQPRVYAGADASEVRIIGKAVAYQRTL